MGSVVTYDYDAYGNLIHSTGTTPNIYLFAAEQFDPDLGLYYNRARYLNTSTGRFWSMDTYEGFDQEPLSLHKYLYTASDPVNHTDPSGRDFDLGSLQVAGAAFTTLATTALVSFQNVLGAIYINLYKVPQVIETASPTTQTSSPQALLAVVQRAVNRVNNLPPQLKGLDRNGLPLTIDRADIKAKGVLIGIPAKPLPWFGTFLQQVRQLSESEGVAVTVQFVEGLDGETIEK